MQLLRRLRRVSILPADLAPSRPHLPANFSPESFVAPLTVKDANCSLSSVLHDSLLLYSSYYPLIDTILHETHFPTFCSSLKLTWHTKDGEKSSHLLQRPSAKNGSSSVLPRGPTLRKELYSLQLSWCSRSMIPTSQLSSFAGSIDSWAASRRNHQE